MKLDFSVFHPLDHWPGTRRCRSLPGGTLNHLSLTWHMRRREELLRPVYRYGLCHLGRHMEVVAYAIKDGRRSIRPSCLACDWTRLPSEHDIDRAAEIRRLLDP